MDCQIDIHDSEIDPIKDVCDSLEGHIGKFDTPERFREEVINRFHEIGFEVHCVFEARIIEGTEVFMPQITIVDRVTEFDPDRQVHEVVHDVLGTGESGFITRGGLIKEPPKKVHFPGGGQ